MKITKQNFLAIGLTAGLVALSSQVYAQDNNNENTLPKAPTVTSQELAQGATHLFSNIGGAFKTGLQKVGATTGKVMQNAGEGLQHISGVKDTSHKEVAENETSKQSESANNKDKKHKKSHYSTEDNDTTQAPTQVQTTVASNANNNGQSQSIINPAEKVVSGAKDKVVGAISWLRSKATSNNNTNENDNSPKP